jgi:hypothetical protein
MVSQPEPASAPDPPAARIELLLSEYGQFGTLPESALHFACSHRQAIVNALALPAFILRQVAAADRPVFGLTLIWP